MKDPIMFAIYIERRSRKVFSVALESTGPQLEYLRLMYSLKWDQRFYEPLSENYIKVE